MSILLFYYALLGVFAITSAVAAPTGSPPPTQNRAPLALPLRCHRSTVNPTPGASRPQANVPEDAWKLLSHNGGTLGGEDWYRIISSDTPGFEWPQMDDVINFEVIEGITNVAHFRFQRSVGKEKHLVKDHIVEHSSLTPVNEISGIKICPLGGYWTTVSGFTTV